MNEIWVFAEQREGALQSVSCELLSKGRDLAAKSGYALAAVLLSENGGALAPELFAHGAEKVYALDAPQFAHFQNDWWTDAFVSLVREKAPEIVLVGATTNGRSLAPTAAAILHCGLTADCTQLDFAPEAKLLQQTRPAFGGNIMATIMTPNHRPQMATVRPKVFKKGVPEAAYSGEVVAEALKLIAPKTRLVESVRDPDAIDIAAPEILVSGGRGLKKEENFKMLFRLAELLGGEVSCSRAVVDAGWAPVSRQVGQTGKTVAPKLYLCFGISGAIQHLEGIRGADTIVAVNSDPNAPIFGVADLGIVGDLFDVLPALIKELEK